MLVEEYGSRSRPSAGMVVRDAMLVRGNGDCGWPQTPTKEAQSTCRRGPKAIGPGRRAGGASVGLAGPHGIGVPR